MPVKPFQYNIRRFLGSGGFADVYLVERSDNGLQFAAKIIREGWDPIARLRLWEEAFRQQRAQGERVVRVIEVNLAAPRPFMILAHMQRGSLADRLDESRRQGARWWKLTSSLRVMIEVASALADVHARGLIHRDVKPANVLIDERGKLYLNDFGCAATALPGQIVQAGFCGTPLYAAPEHARSPSSKSDVYALGVMLFELLTGAPLPASWWTMQIAWPSMLRGAEIPREVDVLIARFCQPDPKNRPSAQQATFFLTQALERAEAAVAFTELLRRNARRWA